MKNRLSRRTFLRAAGISLALPAFEAMNPIAFAAQAATSPKRSVMICTSLGLHGPSLFPEKTGADYEMTPYLELLKDHRDKFTLFSGLSHPDQAGKDGHSSEMTWLTSARNPGLGGFKNSISVDQYIAGEFGYVTRFPSVVLATGGGNSQSYNRNGVLVPAEYRPSVVFERMFMQGKPHEIETQRQQLSQGRSILDSLSDQTRTLRKRITNGDRDRLDQYFESIRQAENRFMERNEWIDKPKPSIEAEQPQDVTEAADILGQTQLLMDMIPLIVQTDSSRVITVLVNGRGDVPPVEGVTIDHHNLSHHGQDESKIDQLQRIEKGIVKCYGSLIEQLKTKQEGEGSLLDNTTVMFGSNLGNANAHDWRNLPIMLAGGNFNHGQHVGFNKENNTPLSNLFVSIMQHAGINQDSFGSSTGRLDW